MNIWLVTTGSSDVQLKAKENWTKLFRDARNQVDGRGFTPTEGTESRFLVPGRVMGIVYSQPQAAQYFDDLVFPLLDNFVNQIEGKLLDKIILILSNQDSVFTLSERRSQHHPYWQDTCTLQPILEKYLKSRFPHPDIHPLFLQPTSSSEGLDDWNSVFNLVQCKFSALELPDDVTVYVSHQAGTPAISSAVQFASLAKFGDRVKFLVSNEHNPTLTGFVESSSYLRGIKLQQAKQLLDRHDYSGVQALIKTDNDTRVLLDAAIQWNFAKFDEFANTVQQSSDQELAQEVKERSQHWWWIAYEETYLAIIRKDQGNIVEAFFHSFRAFEGIFAAWGKDEFKEHIEIQKGVPYLSISVLTAPKDYFSQSQCKKSSDLKKLRSNIEAEARVELNLATLCKLFRSCRREYKQECEELKIFWDSDKEKNVSEKRNFIMHQVQGMSKEDLWKFWEVSTSKDWEERMQKFLNFIAKEDLPKEFKPLEEASLMVKVHRELGSAIAQL
jgi:hypothetical protein